MFGLVARLFGGGFLSAATGIGNLFVRWHSDAIRGQQISATLQHGAESINGKLARILIRSGDESKELPVLVYEWLRDIGLLVAIYKVWQDHGADILGFFL